MRDDDDCVSPDWSHELPDGVERSDQLAAEPVPVLEHDDEHVYFLQVGEEPDKVLQVVKAGVEPRSVDHSDCRGLRFGEPGSAGV